MPEPVVLRFSLGLRIITTVFFVPLIVGIVIGIGQALASGDSDTSLKVDGGPGVKVVGWLVAIVVGLILWFALLFILRFRATIDRVEGMTVRKLGATTAIRKDEIRSIRVRSVKAPGRGNLASQRTISRVVLDNKEPDQADFVIDQSMTNSNAALEVVAAWAAESPALLAGQDTRDFFAALNEPGAPPPW